MMCFLRRRGFTGFTLVEMLLVTALVAGISLAVFVCLSNGLRLWDRSRVLMVEEDVAVFFDHFSSDMRNSFPFTTLPFEGTEYQVSFPTVIFGPVDPSGSRAFEGYADALGRGRYAFDMSRGALVRFQANYSQAQSSVWGEPRIMVKGLKRVRFQYFAPGSSDAHLSVDPGDFFPAGVEVEVLFMNGNDEKALRRFVAIPAGL